MKKKIVVLFLAVYLSVFFFCTNVWGSRSIQDINNKKHTLSNQIKQEKNKIETYENSKQDLKKEIKKLDKKAEKIGDKLETLNAKIEKTKENIKNKNKSIKKNKRKKLKLYKSLKKKIKFIYENGNRGELQLLLEAETMSDILNKQEYINDIYRVDSDELERLKNVIREIQQEKADLKKEEDELKETKEEYKIQQEDLNRLLSQKQQEIIKFEDKIKSSDLKVSAYQEDIEEQDKILAKIKRSIALKKKREEKKRQAELKKRQEEKKKQETDKQNNKNTVPKQAGKFVWPCPASTGISSGFGYRKHPILKVRKMHNGLDMTASTGAAIVAAQSGEVAKAGYNASMGNYVILNHGDSLLTIYMHCSKLKVRTGQEVNAGQIIATVGSTGRSTGSHLHFGVQYNGTYVNPWNYLK